MNYWLFKTEPETFSINDLKHAPNRTDYWEGVRNYQARNMLRDDVQKGDVVFIYHSNCKEPGIYGIATIIKDGYPDHTALDKDSKYYDAKSTKDNVRWFMVDVKFQKQLKKPILLSELKTYKELKDFQLLKKGNRLSILPVPQPYCDFLKKLIL